jgi:hypothetical protein
MVLKLPLRLLPTRVTAAMITTAIRATMRPCSIAVVPDASWTKQECKLLMLLRVLMLIDQSVKHGRLIPIQTFRSNSASLNNHYLNENLIEN